MALTNKVEAFKKHFDIDFISAVEFCLDTKNNLVAKFEGKEYILTNERNKELLSYKTIKFTKKYGTEFLRAIKLEGPKKKVVKSKQIKVHTDKQLLIGNLKHANFISEDWDIDSYGFVYEYEELMLNEECCKDLKIPKLLWPFMLFSFERLSSIISNYRYDFDPKLLEFLGVNTKFGAPGWGLKHAYEEDLKSRWWILWNLSHQINKKVNMYDHDISKREKAILKEYSDLEKEQDEWDEKFCIEEGRKQYLKECTAMNITFDDFLN